MCICSPLLENNKIFNLILLLHKTFCHAGIIENIGENAYKNKFFYLFEIHAAECHVIYVRFENAVYRANDKVILKSLYYVRYRATGADVRFCGGPEMHINEAAWQVCTCNSIWIVQLKHGFSSVETWLFILRGTAFYVHVIINY